MDHRGVWGQFAVEDAAVKVGGVLTKTPQGVIPTGPVRANLVDIINEVGAPTRDRHLLLDSVGFVPGSDVPYKRLG